MHRESSDEHCLELIRAGGRKRDQGVTLLYEAYASEFRRFFVYQCGNTGDADDLVQDTFVKIVRDCDTYRGDCPLQAWLWLIARNCMNDHFRRKKVRPTDNLDDDGWEALQQTSEMLRVIDPPIAGDTLEDCVSKGFKEFAKKQPERAYALSLVVEGFDTRYISNAIQRNEGATREFLSQCRKKIEEFLLPCREYLATD